MPKVEFFPDRPDAQPIIYAYCEPNNPQLKGMLKVGYTSRTIEERMHEHYPTLKPGDKPQVIFHLAEGKQGTVYEYCNLHGLWKAEA